MAQDVFDGKLTSRVKDLRGRKVLTEFVNAGAPEEILYKAHPHVGTDLLRDIVKNIRKEIIALGGEVRFKTQVKNFKISDGQLQGLVLTTGEEILAEQAILAIGHSARDTFSELYADGVKMTAKSWQLVFAWNTRKKSSIVPSIRSSPGIPDLCCGISLDL